jgi:hypothetical protein
MRLPINPVGCGACSALAAWRVDVLGGGGVSLFRLNNLHLSRRHRSRLLPTLYSGLWQVDIYLSSIPIHQLMLQYTSATSRAVAKPSRHILATSAIDPLFRSRSKQTNRKTSYLKHGFTEEILIWARDPAYFAMRNKTGQSYSQPYIEAASKLQTLRACCSGCRYATKL